MRARSETIINYLKRHYRLMIGEETADQLDGELLAVVGRSKAEIRGRDLVSGLPKTVVVTTQELRRALAEPDQA